jgi:hypothetical protein
VLELSNSQFLNPLTIVQREGKKPRICVDARKINQVTNPDYERSSPMQELLQKFEGTRYMSTIDLVPSWIPTGADVFFVRSVISGYHSEFDTLPRYQTVSFSECSSFLGYRPVFP